MRRIAHRRHDEGAGQGADAGSGHQQSGSTGSCVQYQLAERGQQLRVGHGKEPEGEPNADDGECHRVRPAIPQPAPELGEYARPLIPGDRGDPPDHEQCDGAHAEAAGCQVERRSQSGQFDHKPGHGRPSDSSRVHHRRVQDYGVHQVVAVHQVADYGQPGRRIDGLQGAEDEGRCVDMPQGNQSAGFQHRDPKHQQCHQGLRQHQQPAPIEPVGEGAAEKNEPQRGHPVQEDHEAHAGRGIGQFQDEPAQDEELHPPTQRLGVGADPEPAVIPVPQRAEGLEPAPGSQNLGQLIHRIVMHPG